METVGKQMCYFPNRSLCGCKTHRNENLQSIKANGCSNFVKEKLRANSDCARNQLRVIS